MGQPAAKAGDKIQALDSHLVIVPVTPPTSVLLPHKFEGTIDGKLSSNVRIGGKNAATVDSTATNPPHVPQSPGTAFQKPPSNTGTIQLGSQSVFINGKGAARNGDPALTCNDPADAPIGTVVANGDVRIG